MTLLNLYVCDLFGLLGPGTGQWYGLIVLYLGPETMMPVASFLAGIIGAILMFWQRLMRWKRKLVLYVKNKTRKPAETKHPSSG